MATLSPSVTADKLHDSPNSHDGHDSIVTSPSHLASAQSLFPMLHRILHSYPARFTFLIVAGTAALMIHQIRRFLVIAK